MCFKKLTLLPRL